MKRKVFVRNPVENAGRGGKKVCVFVFVFIHSEYVCVFVYMNLS